MNLLRNLIALLWLASSTAALAQDVPSLNPYDAAVSADFKYACAEEIRQVDAATPGSSTFAHWKDQFREWRAPGISFDRIRTENRPQWIPSHYLTACASITYLVQRKSGVGSGKEALARWRALRASFEKSLTQ